MVLLGDIGQVEAHFRLLGGVNQLEDRFSLFGR
jgi:hypothetical protein